MRPSGADSRTLLVTLAGDDRPGLTTRLFDTVALGGVDVLDVEQVVVRGHLSLAVLLAVSPVAPGDVPEDLSARIATFADEHDLSHRVLPGTGDSAPGAGSRLHVAVLGRPLSPAAVAAVTSRLAAAGANIDRVRRLSAEPVTTIELDVSGVMDLRALRRDLTATAASLGVDVAVSPSGLARHGRRLVVLDVDSTLIQDEVIELLAHQAGSGAEVAEVTARAMRGEIDFEDSLRIRVATLAGLPDEVFRTVGAQIRLTPGAQTLTRTLRRLGYTLALVSGGFRQVVDPLAASLGIRRVHANSLEVVDGVLTGRLDAPVVDRRAKADALRRFAGDDDLPMSRTVAIGDGANDLDMLAAAGLGIAFNAKPVVREQADASVTMPYLDSVLFLLGLTHDEIAEADDL